MKFRIYQLFFLAAAALLLVAMFNQVLQIIEPNGATYVLRNFSLTKPDGGISHAAVALGVVLTVAVPVNLFGLVVSLFSNFELQKRCSILSMLLLAGYYILLLLCVLLFAGDGVSLFDSLALKPAIMYPFTAIVLNMLSFLSARRTEAQILAKATGFRLRD